MLRVVYFLLTIVVLGTCYPYNPYCQNWCYGAHRSFVEPQLCSTYCGGYSGSYTGNYGSSCCSESSYPISYSGSAVGPISWPGYGYYGQSSSQAQYPSQSQYSSQAQYPSQGQYPIHAQYPNYGQYPIQALYPTQGQYPINQGSYISVNPNNPVVPSNNDPIRITVDSNAQKAKEYICPADPSPRAGTNYSPSQQSSGPVHCQYDENCTNHPHRQKCCHDNAIGAKVCKPAVLV